MKKQIVVIGGGDSFGTYEEYLNFLKNFEVTTDYFRPHKDWKSVLQERLGEEYDVLAPAMPNKTNAKFGEWKLWFEKMISFIDDGIVLIGHSLGGMFLVKYLAENQFPKKITALFLVAAPHNETGEIGDFIVPENIQGVSRQVSKIYLLYSKDDKIVPFSEKEAYEKQLPGSRAVVFENRGHFNQPEFPEIVNLIKNL